MYRFEIKKPVAVTATGIVHTGACWFKGFMVTTDGTNDVTITFRDGIDATGDVFFAESMVIETSKGKVQVHNSPVRFKCNTGIHVTITCAGTCGVVPFFSVGD